MTPSLCVQPRRECGGKNRSQAGDDEMRLGAEKVAQQGTAPGSHLFRCLPPPKLVSLHITVLLGPGLREQSGPLEAFCQGTVPQTHSRTEALHGGKKSHMHGHCKVEAATRTLREGLRESV